MSPNPPSKAHGFAMRSMSLRDMQISKSEKKNYCPPPLPNPGDTPDYGSDYIWHGCYNVLLSLLFNSFIVHGCLPSDFMKTSLVPIIKSKTGVSSDKNCHRPIALVTAASKFFEIGILEILEMYFITHDQQFGFKNKYATDMCIFTVKSIIMYYTEQIPLCTLAF